VWVGARGWTVVLASIERVGSRARSDVAEWINRGCEHEHREEAVVGSNLSMSASSGCHPNRVQALEIRNNMMYFGSSRSIG